MSGLVVFDFRGRKVRTAGTLEAPLFCAADVCGVLGIANSRDACSRLRQSDVSVEPTIGGKQAAFVTEAGLYKLVMRSRKPEAESFVDWVASEVLPEIRKRGYYSLLERETKQQTERLLEACFPHAPTKSKPIFSDLIAALLKMRNEPRNGNPPWAPFLAQLVYEWAIPVAGQQQKRRDLNRNRTASRVDHSMMSDDVRANVLNVARAGIALAKNSVTWNEWRARMETAFRDAPLQLSLVTPVRRLPGAKKGAA